MPKEHEFQVRVERIEKLIGRVQSIPDPEIRAGTVELIQSLMEMHGAGLNRIMEIVSQAGPPGAGLIDDFAADELISSLLLLYGLHPQELESRILRALEEVRPYVRSNGGCIELMGVDNGIVRIRVEKTAHGCSARAIQTAVERAIYERAPDVTAVEIEGLSDSPRDFVPLSTLFTA